VNPEYEGGFMEPNDTLRNWLNDAYAMEQHVENVLINHTKDARDFPEIGSRLKQHQIETQRHRERIQQCLASLGETPSVIKRMTGRFTGVLQGISTGVFADELVKNAIGDYSMEQFEIGCYTALRSVAEEADRPMITRTCGEILDEEIAMAEWLRSKIPQVALQHLHHSVSHV
jgi:ferritin-like metal-binding protein YciE